MPDSSHAYDADFLARSAAVAHEGTVGCKAGAEHGCCFGGCQAVGDREDPG